jgi:hypothetical protein
MAMYQVLLFGICEVKISDHQLNSVIQALSMGLSHSPSSDGGR